MKRQRSEDVRMKRAIIFAMHDTGLYSSWMIGRYVNLDASTVRHYLKARGEVSHIVCNVPSRINASLDVEQQARRAA